MSRPWILAALLLGATLLPGLPAQACKCAKPGPKPIAAWRASSLVFFGRIAEVTEGPGVRAVPSLLAVFVTENVRKGGASDGDRVVIATPRGSGTCGLDFEEGQTWLIAAPMEEGETLTVQRCGASRKMARVDGARRRMPRVGEPYWDAAFALDTGDLQAALEGFTAVEKSGDKVFGAMARRARLEVMALLKLHERGMDAVESSRLAAALKVAKRIETVKVTILELEHWKDRALLATIQKKAREEALRAIEAKDWPLAYRRAKVLLGAGDVEEGRSLLGLLEYHARPLFNQGKRLSRSSDPKEKAEGRKMLQTVVDMTDPSFNKHQSAKDRLKGKRNKRRDMKDMDIPKFPGRNRQ